MFNKMFTSTFDPYQIFYSIICFDFVYMVNPFFFVEQSTEMYFHYIPMLCIIPLFACKRMFWNVEIPIPRTHDISHRIIFSKTFMATINTVDIISFFGCMFRDKGFPTVFTNSSVLFDSNFCLSFIRTFRRTTDFINRRVSAERFITDGTQLYKFYTFAFHENILPQRKYDVKTFLN